MTVHGTGLEQLLNYLCARHPRAMSGIDEARAVDPSGFTEMAERYLGWALAAYGESAIPWMADAYVQFTSDVNLSQARYEKEGRYEHQHDAASLAGFFENDETMSQYLAGVYLTTFLWAHHMELALFFRERFIPLIKHGAQIAELASGHGGWGLWALEAVEGSVLEGIDLSTAAVVMAESLARGAQLQERAIYRAANVLELQEAPTRQFDACICNFLVEHLASPRELFAVIQQLLVQRGVAFVSGALTAAQQDHVHEFRRESELVLLAEAAGFRVMDLRSVAPRRSLPGARYLPRSASLILQKRGSDTW